MFLQSLKLPKESDQGLFTAELLICGIKLGILQTFGKQLPNELQIYKYKYTNLPPQK